MLPAWMIDNSKKGEEPQGLHIGDEYPPIGQVDEDREDYRRRGREEEHED
jgi:hypothetical protein